MTDKLKQILPLNYTVPYISALQLILFFLMFIDNTVSNFRTTEFHEVFCFENLIFLDQKLHHEHAFGEVLNFAHFSSYTFIFVKVVSNRIRCSLVWSDNMSFTAIVSFDFGFDLDVAGGWIQQNMVNPTTCIMSLSSQDSRSSVGPRLSGFCWVSLCITLTSVLPYLTYTGFISLRRSRSPPKE